MPTPNATAALAASTAGAGLVNQLLGTHQLNYTYGPPTLTNNINANELVEVTSTPIVQTFAGSAASAFSGLVLPLGLLVPNIDAFSTFTSPGADVTVSLISAYGSSAAATVWSVVVPSEWLGLTFGSSFAMIPGASASNGLIPTAAKATEAGVGAWNQASICVTVCINNITFVGTVTANGFVYVAATAYPGANGIGGLCICADGSVIGVGGGVGGVSTAVYTAMLSGIGPGPGITPWTPATVLPTASQFTACIAVGQTVYALGGVNASNVPLTTIYYAIASSGTLSAWASASSLPPGASFLSSVVVGAVGGEYLIYGFVNNPPGGASYAQLYAAAIIPGGALGPWFELPNLLSPLGADLNNIALVVSPVTNTIYVIIEYSIAPILFVIYTLSIGANGDFDTNWQLVTPPFLIGSGAGTYLNMAVIPSATGETLMWSTITQQTQLPFVQSSLVAVPTPATSPTSGVTYAIELSSNPASGVAGAAVASNSGVGFPWGGLSTDAGFVIPTTIATDNGAEMAWVITDAFNNVVAVAEATGNQRSVTEVLYTSYLGKQQAPIGTQVIA
jgi:hypothetical protein